MDASVLRNAQNFQRFIDGFAEARRLGSGGFAVVFAHPFDKTKVVKIADTDTGYDKYAKWCIKNQGVLGVPNIYSHLRIRCKGDFADTFFTITILERLRVCSKEDYNKLAVRQFGADLYNAIDCVCGKDGRKLYASSYFKPQYDRVRALPATSKIILKFLRRNRTELDLFVSNTMVRGRGAQRQLIITDPLAE